MVIAHDDVNIRRDLAICPASSRLGLKKVSKGRVATHSLLRLCISIFTSGQEANTKGPVCVSMYDIG